MKVCRTPELIPYLIETIHTEMPTFVSQTQRTHFFHVHHFTGL